MASLKPATLSDVMAVQRAEELLREARDLLRGAGAIRAADKVRAALTSTGGAVRHVGRRYEANPNAEGKGIASLGE